MKKFKPIFPSRNYITIDASGDVEIIFNPTGDGFEGEDSLKFRRGRWAFRVNDFLSGKVMPNGKTESMFRKVYSLNIVWDDADEEPQISTSYVDPTSVIPLDGSLVTINGFEGVQVTNESLDVNVKNRGLQRSFGYDYSFDYDYENLVVGDSVILCFGGGESHPEIHNTVIKGKVIEIPPEGITMYIDESSNPNIEKTIQTLIFYRRSTQSGTERKISITPYLMAESAPIKFYTGLAIFKESKSYLF